MSDVRNQMPDARCQMPDVDEDISFLVILDQGAIAFTMRLARRIHYVVFTTLYSLGGNTVRGVTQNL